VKEARPKLSHQTKHCSSYALRFLLPLLSPLTRPQTHMALSNIMIAFEDVVGNAASATGMSELVSSPCTAAVVCFLSGLLGSAVLSIVDPSMEEESDLRSFISFAIGAVMCCLFTKFRLTNEPKQPATRVKTGFRHTSSDQRAKQTSYTASAKYSDKIKSPHASAARPAAVTPPWRKTTRPSDVKDCANVPMVKAIVPATPAAYAPNTFRKDVAAIMRDLASHRNVAVAVQQVRERNVPEDRQADELVNILTFALEESRGTARRSYIAFVAGLTGTFDRFECVAGMMQFFNTVYDDLSSEVPRLEKLIRTELVPTLSSVFSPEEFTACIPAQFIDQ